MSAEISTLPKPHANVSKAVLISQIDALLMNSKVGKHILPKNFLMKSKSFWKQKSWSANKPKSSVWIHSWVCLILFYYINNYFGTLTRQSTSHELKNWIQIVNIDINNKWLNIH